MGDKISIQDIVDALSEKFGLSKPDAETFIKTAFDIIEESLETDKYVKVKGLGTFKLTEVSSRESVNVNTGKRFMIEGHSKISFTPDAIIRDLINKPFAHFETVVLNDDTVLEDTRVADGDTDEDQDAETEVVIENTIDNAPEAVITEEPEIKEILESAEQIVEDKQQPVIQDELKEAVPPVNPRSFQEELPKHKSGKPRKWLYITGVLLVTALLATEVIYFIFGPESSKQVQLMNDTSSDTNIPTFLPDEMLHETPEIPSDPELVQEPDLISKDTVTEVIEPIPAAIDTTKTVITGVRKGANNVKADSTSYVIVGTMTTHKIVAGETLTMVSKRFYETKDLWPYLVKHNKGVIKNPDRVPSGTVIRIPALRDKN